MRTILLLLLATSMSGCASIYSVTHGPDQNDIYGGVRLDGRMVGATLTNGRVHCGLQTCDQSKVSFLSFGALCDLPLSLIIDTALLPYTVIAAGMADAQQGTPADSPHRAGPVGG